MVTITLSAFADEANSSIDKQILALKRNNISYIELRGVDGTNIQDISLEKTKEIAKKFTDNNIHVSSIGSPLGKSQITDSFDIVLKNLNNLIEKAKILGTDQIRMFSFFVKAEDYDKYEEEILHRLTKMVEIAKESNIKLCHENESEIFGSTVKNCLTILSKVPGLYSVYDPSNIIVWGENINEAYNKLLPLARYLHIKDCSIKEKTILPAGYGDGLLNETIASINKDITLSIEPHLFEFIGYDKIDNKKLKTALSFENSDQSFDFAVKSLKELLIKNGYKEESNGIWKK